MSTHASAEKPTTRPGLPTVEQVLALPVNAHEIAPKEWEDLNGHVNIRAYYDFHMSDSGEGWERLGWNDTYLERTGNSLFSVEQHLRFYDEALVGHEVSTHLRLVDRNERFLHGVSILVNRTTSRVANTVQFVEAHVNLGTRKPTPFPAEMAETLDRLVAEHRALGWTVPLNSDMGLR